MTGSTGSNLLLSKFINIKAFDYHIKISLKVDDQTIEKFSEMYDSCLNAIIQWAKKINDSYVMGSRHRHNVPADIRGFANNLSFETDFEVPGGFLLTLRDIQKQYLAWMRAVEDRSESDVNTAIRPLHTLSDGKKYVKIRIRKKPYYVDLNESKLTTSPDTPPIPKIKLNGGVLLEKPRSGKKVIALALIHSNPVNIAEMEDIPDLIKSRATVIICTQNAYHQWICEARKCNPEFKIYCFPDEEYTNDSNDQNNFQQELEEKYPKDFFVDLGIILITYGANKRTLIPFSRTCTLLE